MAVKHHWNTRECRFNSEADDVERIAKVTAEYVFSKEKVREEAHVVQLIVRGAGITPGKLRDAMAAAIRNDRY